MRESSDLLGQPVRALRRRLAEFERAGGPPHSQPSSPGLSSGATYGSGGVGRAPIGSADLESIYDLQHMIESFKEGIGDSSGAQAKHAYPSTLSRPPFPPSFARPRLRSSPRWRFAARCTT